MPRRLTQDGMEIDSADLSAYTATLEMELYDRIIYELCNRQKNFVFRDSFICTYVNATTSQVLKGLGNFYDNTQVDPEPMNRQLYLATQNVTHAAADGSHDRIDIICITPARANIQSVTRNVKNASTAVITPTSVVVEDDWKSTLVVTAGTPGVSPAVPSTPAGAIKLAEVRVTATTGIANQAAITDKRPRYRTKGWDAVVTKTSAYTADLDDNIISCNASGGAFAITLPPAATAFDSTLNVGKTFQIFKSDSSANAITLQADGAELIQGANSQAISTQYTYLTVVSDGSQWLIK